MPPSCSSSPFLKLEGAISLKMSLSLFLTSFSLSLSYSFLSRRHHHPFPLHQHSQRERCLCTLLVPWPGDTWFLQLPPMGLTSPGSGGEGACFPGSCGIVTLGETVLGRQLTEAYPDFLRKRPVCWSRSFGLGSRLLAQRTQATEMLSGNRGYGHSLCALPLPHCTPLYLPQRPLYPLTSSSTLVLQGTSPLLGPGG